MNGRKSEEKSFAEFTQKFKDALTYSKVERTSDNLDHRKLLYSICALFFTTIKVYFAYKSWSLSVAFEAVFTFSDSIDAVIAAIGKCFTNKRFSKYTYGVERIETMGHFVNYLIIMMIAIWALGVSIYLVATR